MAVSNVGKYQASEPSQSMTDHAIPTHVGQIPRPVKSVFFLSHPQSVRARNMNDTHRCGDPSCRNNVKATATLSRRRFILGWCWTATAILPGLLLYSRQQRRTPAQYTCVVDGPFAWGLTVPVLSGEAAFVMFRNIRFMEHRESGRVFVSFQFKGPVDAKLDRRLDSVATSKWKRSLRRRRSGAMILVLKSHRIKRSSGQNWGLRVIVCRLICSLKCSGLMSSS